LDTFHHKGRFEILGLPLSQEKQRMPLVYCSDFSGNECYRRSFLQQLLSHSIQISLQPSFLKASKANRLRIALPVLMWDTHTPVGHVST
jgi:hypothetical protein